MKPATSHQRAAMRLFHLAREYGEYLPVDEEEAFNTFSATVRARGGETRSDYVARVARSLCRLYDDVQNSGPEIRELVTEFQAFVEKALELSWMEAIEFRNVVSTFDGHGMAWENDVDFDERDDGSDDPEEQEK